MATSAMRPTLFARFREFVYSKTAKHPKLHSFVAHEAGPMTIFFWAPAWKWGLVAAGIADLSRPAESLSLPQTCALAATGLIWCRYSMVIIPKNWNLFAVNLFVSATGCYQLKRIYDAGLLTLPKMPAQLPALPNPFSDGKPKPPPAPAQ